MTAPTPAPETWVIDGVNQDFSSKAEAEQFLLELMQENGDTVCLYGLPYKWNGVCEGRR